MTTKVAVVTGSNKGIGYAIVKGLCEKFDGKVYLTSRNEQLGKEAVKKLESIGLKPAYHQLDITDEKSINAFRKHLQDVDGGIDVLVNNAAIAFKAASTEPFSEQADVTIKVNYFATLKVCDGLFPLLRPNAQVVNVSSLAGHLFFIPSTNLRNQFSDENLTVETLSGLMEKFVADAKNGEHTDKGWPNNAYVVSKIGLSALSIIQQKQLDKEKKQRNVSVNFVHPGYVDTDLTSHKGPLTIEEGAIAPLFLALGGHGLRGKYVWNDCKLVDWFSKLDPSLNPFQR